MAGQLLVTCQDASPNHWAPTMPRLKQNRYVVPTSNTEFPNKGRHHLLSPHFGCLPSIKTTRSKHVAVRASSRILWHITSNGKVLAQLVAGPCMAWTRRGTGFPSPAVSSSGFHPFPGSFLLAALRWVVLGRACEWHGDVELVECEGIKTNKGWETIAAV